MQMQEETDKLQQDEAVHVQQKAMQPHTEKKCHEKCCTAILFKLEQWIYEPEQKDQKSIDFFPLFRAKALPDYKVPQ